MTFASRILTAPARSWDSGSGIFTLRREQSNPGGSFYRNPDGSTQSFRPPNIAAGLRITAVDDGIAETQDEVVAITVTQPANFPTAWGSVADAPHPHVETSTTFELTILGENNNILFTTESSSVIEGGAVDLEVRIAPQLATASSVLLTSTGGPVTITGNQYDASTNVLTLPARTDSVRLRVETNPDGDSNDGIVTLTLAPRTPDELPSSHKIHASRNEHVINILEPREVAFTAGAPNIEIRYRTIVSGVGSRLIGHQPHRVHARLNEPSTGVSSSVNVDGFREQHGRLGRVEFGAGCPAGADGFCRGRHGSLPSARPAQFRRHAGLFNSRIGDD